MAKSTFNLPAPAPTITRPPAVSGLLAPTRFMRLVALVLFIAAAVLPFISASPYLISILTSAMIYIVLAMGLNVVVGLAGLGSARILVNECEQIGERRGLT